MNKFGSVTKVLKPEEKTLPSVVYKGHNKEMEAKIPKGKVHDPYSYEIETWTQLEPQFPKKNRVMWAKVEIKPRG
jgi:tetrathionate reductase subunit B